MPLPPLPGRGERRSRRRLQVILLFVSMVVLADAVVGERGLVERYRAAHEYQQLRDAIIDLRGRNEALRDQAARLKQDAAAIERVARQDLGLIRPGEIVVLVKSVN
jgi:cell division protein FtsB